MTGQHLVLYDGVCELCNGLNRFLLPRDVRGAFVFAPLQSRVARETLSRFGRDPDDLDTLYVVVGYRTAAPVLLSKARAVLFVMKSIGRPWSWLGALGVLPTAVLNRAYDAIARRRYRLAGRYESCPVPSAEYKQRFIA